jgi:hypothetical protein
MATVMDGPTATKSQTRWSGFLQMPELWGAIAIAFMWLAVLFASTGGGDFVSVNGAGAQSTTIPSGVFVAFFASLATVAVARRAFRRDSGSSGVDARAADDGPR